MPALITHYLCGDKVLRLLENQDLRDLIETGRQVFNLGAQGPDFLFYHRAWPWTKGCGIDKVGGRLHDENVGGLFKAALAYAGEASGQDKKLLTAYLCGFLCHYSLDLHAHPYVFYRSGFIREGEPTTPRYSSFHRRFEATVDVLMLERLCGLKPRALKLSRLISVDRTAAAVIGRLFERIFSEAYGLDISYVQAAEAIRDMAGITAFLQDNRGWKKKLLGRLEEKRTGYPLTASLIHPQTVEDGLDYLNLSHSVWRMPWDEEQTSAKSFVELFDEAVSEAVELCETLYGFLSGDISLDGAIERIGGRSFSSGLDCGEDAVFRYYDCIYKAPTPFARSDANE